MTATSAASRLADIKKLISSKDFPRALQALEEMLERDPENAEALYMAAVSCRYTQDYDRAQACLDGLMLLPYDRGRVYQEQGHLHVACHRADQALASFANACQLNPALVASWRNQQNILQKKGFLEEAQQAQAQVARLQRLPKALLAVTDLIAQGKLFKAETLCRNFLKANPTHVEAMRLLAELAVQFGVLDDAEFLLESAAEFDPANIQVKIDQVGVLRKRQKFKQAVAAAEALFNEQPGNPQFMSLYAIETMQLGDYSRAIDLFDRVLDILPGDAITLTSRGHALKTCGQQEEAIESYRAAVRSNPLHGEAYYALSNLKTYRFKNREVQDMLALERRAEAGPISKLHVAFALGKAFEDEQDYARSFEYYAQGNRLKRQQSTYDAGKMSEELQAQREFFTRERLDPRSGVGFDDTAPIFIVGLPRAGSTLLEQVLSSHSQVDGTLELPNILSAAQKMRRQFRQGGGNPYPACLDDISDEDLRSLGQQYIEETRIHRQGAPFFIDKMPNNFRHIGLIKRILPNARIIDARRHPMACCFSGYKQLFAEGQEFSYDLGDIGAYYNDYEQLMAHWDNVSPGTVLRVYYEQVVADLEAQVSRILDFCQLPFESACLEFHRTERAVRTASSEQVRQPIYDSGVEQWRHYRQFLGTLEELLQPSIERYPV